SPTQPPTPNPLLSASLFRPPHNASYLSPAAVQRHSRRLPPTPPPPPRLSSLLRIQFLALRLPQFTVTLLSQHSKFLPLIFFARTIIGFCGKLPRRIIGFAARVSVCGI
ncbi:hypothetical protein ACLOJK_018068, partial [Asimina triloba]